jgi:ribokinase
MKNPHVVAVGSVGIDHYYLCETWPTLGDKARVHYKESRVGGMIPNAACILANYGIETYLFDQIGDDSHTPLILDDLQSFGLNTSCLSIEAGMPNNQNFIMLAENEKTIFLIENPKPPLILDDRRKELLRNASYVYTTIPDLKKLERHNDVIRELKNRNVGVLLDVESESFVSAEEDWSYFELARILCFNENAFEKFSTGPGHVPGWGQLLAREDKIMVVTLGDKGCTVLSGDRRLSVKGIPVEVVDTTGAGDTFNATFLYGLMQGWDLEQCARFANAAAARSVMYLGPKAGAVSANTVNEFMQRRGSQ